MKELITRLEQKWGAFETDQHYLKQWDTSNGSRKAYLNVLFNPAAQSELRFAEESLECKFPPSLCKFYEQYNGMMLFSESLRIYGIKANFSAPYIPYDIVKHNKLDDIHSYGTQFLNYVVFGYYSSCLFCFDKTNLNLLHVVDKKQRKIVYSFANLSELLSHYVNYLIEEYSETGKKIHYDKRFEGLPIANVSLEFI